MNGFMGTPGGGMITPGGGMITPGATPGMNFMGGHQ